MEGGRKYVWTVDDVMAIKPRFLASMGDHIFLTTVFRARAFGTRGAPLKFYLKAKLRSIRTKMDKNVEFTRHVSINHQSSSVASVRYSANLNLSQCYNFKLPPGKRYNNTKCKQSNNVRANSVTKEKTNLRA